MTEILAALLFCDMQTKEDKTGYQLKFNFGRFLAGTLQAGAAFAAGMFL